MFCDAVAAVTRARCPCFDSYCAEFRPCKHPTGVSGIPGNYGFHSLHLKQSSEDKTVVGFYCW